MLPSADRASLVFSGSLKYSKGEAVLNQTCPGVSVGAWFHGLDENMELAEQHLADGAAMGDPFRAVAGGEAKAFGRAVIFVDDRPPPFDHVVLPQGWAGRSGMDRYLERGEVIVLSRLLRQL